MANLSVRTALFLDAFATSAFSGEFEPGSATRIRLRIDADDYVDFIGTGFTYGAGGVPTGGTIKSITSVVEGAVQFTLTQFSVALTSAVAAIQTADQDTVFTLFLGANDRITGKDGADLLRGYGGTDSMTGGLGSDTLYGDDGNDKLYMQDNGGADSGYGGTGNDTFYIDSADSIFETDGEGTDTAYIRGDFTLAEGNSVETLIAQGNVDGEITGNSARNTIKGDASDNVLSGLGDRDSLFGGSGVDFIYGGDEYDRIFGDGGNDFLYGDEGTDRLEGGSGNDTLFGGADGDRDTFIFTVSTASFGRDIVADFEDAVDRIQINGFASFAAATSGGMTISEDAGGNALIKFTGPISTITLTGIDQAQITAADFIFSA